MKYDIYMVGVGGQGILTIGKILAEAAQKQGLVINFFPSKGMAQRGGFVKAQLRIGRKCVGPNIPEGGADLVIAEELSESLKAIRYARYGGDFLLSGETWMPTAVMLGKASYPEVDVVKRQIENHGSRLFYVDPKSYPIYGVSLAPVNLFILGLTLRNTTLSNIIQPANVKAVMFENWKHDLDAAEFAFQAGMETQIP